MEAHVRLHHPLVCFLDRPEISSGEALAGIVRDGRAGSNTTADHITVLDMALASLPRGPPRPGDPDSPRLLVRADAAGATHDFARFCRERGVAFSFGFAIDEEVRKAIVSLPESAWTEAIETDGEVRDGAWVAEITRCSTFALARGFPGHRPQGTPAPRCPAQPLRHRSRAAPHRFHHRRGSAHRGIALAIPALELRHRHHARVEDRIRQAKARACATCRARR